MSVRRDRRCPVCAALHTGRHILAHLLMHAYHEALARIYGLPAAHGPLHGRETPIARRRRYLRKKAEKALTRNGMFA